MAQQSQLVDPSFLEMKQIRETDNLWYINPDSGSSTIDIIIDNARVITPTDEEQCPVCLDYYKDGETAISLNKCGSGHHFHKDCIKTALDAQSKCPFCNTFYHIPTGIQPSGKMAITLQPFLLPGMQYRLPNGQISIATDACQFPSEVKEYTIQNPDMPFGTYIIAYQFPPGIQGPEHPNPGMPYTGTARRAFIPGTRDGHRVLQKFLKAWDARLLFRIGTSLTTGNTNTVIWNGIPHKTNISGGPTQFGFPDPDYITVVEEALSAVGIL